MQIKIIRPNDDYLTLNVRNRGVRLQWTEGQLTLRFTRVGSTDLTVMVMDFDPLKDRVETSPS